MMKKTGIILFAMGVSLFSACKREDEEPIGGKGGNAVLVLKMQHHILAIDSGKIYIKYNTLDKPSGGYDDSTALTGTPNNATATFSGLKKGKYFLFGRGFDPSIAQPVEGGIPHTITDEHTHNLTIPVTEAGH